MTELEQPQFTIVQVAAAAGIEANTLRSWFQRGHFTLGDSDKRADFGDAHLLSLRTALQVGTAVEIYRSGAHPARAAKLALAFTLVADVDQTSGEIIRGAGELFPGNGVYTALIAYPGIDDAKVVRFDDKGPALSAAFHSNGYGRQNSAQIVWLNFVDRKIRIALLGIA